MATTMKDTNMPAISANIAAKLHRWVKRATTVQGREKQPENIMNAERDNLKERPRELAIASKIIPLHGRSRSSPVEMSYDVPKRKASTHSLEKDYKETPKMSRDGNSTLDLSVQSGSLDDLRLLLTSNLKKKCSQSTNSLSDVSWSGEVDEMKTKRMTMRRTSSEDTQESCESYGSSELDINRNEKRTKTRNKTKTNKRNNVQTPVESSSSKNARAKLVWSRKIDEITSRDIHSRLDKWLEKASKYSPPKQGSFESTSSIATCSSDGDVFCCENQKVSPRETRELIELQTALKELVTNCGTRSPRRYSNKEKSSTDAAKDMLERRRSYSLQDVGESWKRGSNGTQGGIVDGVKRNISDGNLSNFVEISELNGDAYTCKDYGKLCKDDNLNGDSTDSITMRVNGVNKWDKSVTIIEHDATSVGARQQEIMINEEAKEFGTRATNSESMSRPEVVKIMESGKLEEDGGKTADCGVTLGNDDPDVHSSEGSDFKAGKANSLKPAPKSPKSYPAPSPPCSRLETQSEQRELRESMRRCLDFNDADLSAFAVECVRHANVKKTKKPKMKNGEKNGSGEEDERNGKAADDPKDIPNGRTRSPSNSLEREGKESKWSSQSSILTNSSSEEKTSRDKIELSDEDYKLIRSALEEDFSQRAIKFSSSESLNDMTAFEEGVILVDTPNDRRSPLEKDFNGKNEVQYKDAEVKENSNLRKFPSLPLFYIPKEDFDSENTRGSKSLRRSIWEKIKKHSPNSLTRSTENLSKPSRSKRSLSPPPRLLDPFYHAESDIGDDMQPMTRPKAYTHSGETKTTPTNSCAQIRPSLETRRSVPLWKKSFKRNNKGSGEDTGNIDDAPTLTQPGGMVEELI